MQAATRHPLHRSYYPLVFLVFIDNNMLLSSAFPQSPLIQYRHIGLFTMALTVASLGLAMGQRHAALTQKSVSFSPWIEGPLFAFVVCKC